MTEHPKKPFNNISARQIAGLELFNYVGQREAKRADVRRFLRNNADLGVRDTVGNGVVTQAVMAGNYGIVEELIKSGADFKSPNISDMTPLMIAAYLGLKGSAGVLAKAGATITRSQARAVLAMAAEEDEENADKLAAAKKSPDYYLLRTLEVFKIIKVVPDTPKGHSFK